MSAIDVMALRAPDLVPSTTDARVVNMVAYTRTRIKSELYGEQAETAIALYALHLLTKDAIGTAIGGGGQITADHEGSLSRSYSHAPVSASAEDLASTAFGKEYLSLRSACLPHFLTSGFPL